MEMSELASTSYCWRVGCSPKFLEMLLVSGPNELPLVTHTDSNVLEEGQVQSSGNEAFNSFPKNNMPTIITFAKRI